MGCLPNVRLTSFHLPDEGEASQRHTSTMAHEMKNRYRRFRQSWGVYYAFDNTTGNSKTLKTRTRRPPSAWFRP